MKHVVIILIVCLAACSRGRWISDDAYRPKKQHFSVAKSSFKNSSFIDNNRVYVLTRPFVNYDNRVFRSFMGFYDDGTVVFSSALENDLRDAVQQKSSMNTASTIGQYTTDGQNLTVELFLPADGGTYHQMKGVIKGDTIIFDKSVNKLFKKEIRYDTLVRSSFLISK